MIIEMFLRAIQYILDFFTQNISIPQFPDEITEYIDTALGYIGAGAGILANYTPLALLLTLFGILLAVDIGIALYHFVMWILRKIPMAGIS